MKLIKEICLGEGDRITTGVVRSNCYGSQLSYIKKLVRAAKKTFPQLTDDDIRVVHFGGDRYARTYGIEFPLLQDTIPKGWKEIHRLELLK